MQDKSILRRIIAATKRTSGVFWSTEPVVHYNHVLAKWDRYYEAHPNSFSRRNQVGVLGYLTSAD